jgi:hypothetical protein
MDWDSGTQSGIYSAITEIVKNYFRKYDKIFYNDNSIPI